MCRFCWCCLLTVLHNLFRPLFSFFSEHSGWGGRSAVSWLSIWISSSAARRRPAAAGWPSWPDRGPCEHQLRRGRTRPRWSHDVFILMTSFWKHQLWKMQGKQGFIGEFAQALRHERNVHCTQNKRHRDLTFSLFTSLPCQSKNF